MQWPAMYPVAPVTNTSGFVSFGAMAMSSSSMALSDRRGS